MSAYLAEWLGRDMAGHTVEIYPSRSEANTALRRRQVASVAPRHQGGGHIDRSEVDCELYCKNPVIK